MHGHGRCLICALLANVSHPLNAYSSSPQLLHQVIDDTAGNTLAAASTLTPDVRSQLGGALGANQVLLLTPASVLHVCPTTLMRNPTM